MWFGTDSGVFGSASSGDRIKQVAHSLCVEAEDEGFVFCGSCLALIPPGCFPMLPREARKEGLGGLMGKRGSV